MNKFMEALDEMGVVYKAAALDENLNVVDIPLPQRKTEELRFVFRGDKYLNHRIHKV